MHLLLRALSLSAVFLVAACGGGTSDPEPSGPQVPPGPPILTPLTSVNWEVPPVHPLDLHAGASLLALAHTEDHRLEVFDVASGFPEPSISVPVGLCPVSARFRTATEVWVVNHLSDTVSVVDLTTGLVRATLQTLDEPADVVFAGSPQRAFVSCSQANAVQVFDPFALGAPPVTVPIEGEEPRALAVSPDGSAVHVAVFESGNGSTVLGGGVDPSAAVVGFPPNVSSDPSTPHQGVNPAPNDGNAFSPPLNPANGTPPAVSTIVKRDAGGAWRDDTGADWTPLVSGASAPLSGRPVGWELVDHDLARIDTANLSVTYTSGLMNLCMSLAVHPANGDVVVVGTDATNEIRFEPKLKGRFLRVLAARVPGGAGTPSVADMNPHLDYQSSIVPEATRRLSIGDPRGAAFDAAGNRLYVTGMGSDNVVVFDGAGARVGAPISVGRGPVGIAVHTSASRLHVWNRFEGSLSVVDVATGSELARVPIFDPTLPAVREGRVFLYDTHRTSGLGHVACASCHADARMDRLAWDLGVPNGLTKSVAGQNCLTDLGILGIGACEDWHPMKGPMTTQTLQDIIGHEPHHWRGDRDGIEEFNQAFLGLLGDDELLSVEEMQAFEDFLATIAFPPNPHRGIDNSLPEDLPLPGQFTPGRFGPAGLPLPNGNARRGLDLYRHGALDGGVPGFQCITCHTLPTGLGTDTQFQPNLIAPGSSTFDPIPVGPRGEHHIALVSVDGFTNVTIKVPHLMNMYEKVGFEMTQSRSLAGFGFVHDGTVDSIPRFVSEPVFNVASVQDVADLTALMMAFAGGGFDAPGGGGPFDLPEPPGPPGQMTHAGVGAQVGYAGGALPSRVLEMVALADTGAVELIVRGSDGEGARGWLYDRAAAVFQSDVNGATILMGDLLDLAADGREQTWTLVPLGLGTRLGLDRDEDGAFDGTERLAGTDPANQSSVPSP